MKEREDEREREDVRERGGRCKYHPFAADSGDIGMIDDDTSIDGGSI